VAQLSDAQRAFLEDNAFVATVTTLRADGSPHSTVVWVDTDGGVVRFNTFRGAAKERHLGRDPRVSVAVLDPRDPWHWVAVSGTAELIEEGADAHIDRLAQKYLGVESYPYRDPAERRVTVRVTPVTVASAGFSA